MKHPHDRAHRRANQQAVDAATRRMLGRWGFDGAWHKFRRQRQPCSCMGCGNQRAHLGPKLQELRHDTFRT